MRRLYLTIPALTFLVGLMLFALTAAGLAGDSTNGRLNAVPAEKRLLSEAEVIGRLRQLEPGFSGPLNRGAVDCEIQNGLGDPVTQVSAAELGDRAYWLNYFSNGTESQRVTFIVMPMFEGSPLAGQRQLFTPGPESAFDNIATPFGIPFWGLDLTSGPWLLVVRSDNDAQAACPFEVVP